MLNKYLLAAGTLLAATLVAAAPASASTHHARRGVRGVAHVALAHAGGRHLGRARAFGGARTFVRGRSFARGRFAGRARVAGHRYTVAGLRHGRLHVARRSMRLARRGYGRRVVAAVTPDDLIRNLVGPASSYTPATSGGQVGGASYYSGGRTASGGVVGAATCAHRSLPFGTRVLVTNLNNARQAVLTVNDRGPFVGGRIIDVSRTAAGTLGMLGSGVARVSVKVVGGPG